MYGHANSVIGILLFIKTHIINQRWVLFGNNKQRGHTEKVPYRPRPPPPLPPPTRPLPCISPSSQISHLRASRTITSQPLVFLSYKWGNDEMGRNNNDRVVALHAHLKTHGIRTWLDVYDMDTHHMTQSMCKGIDCCDVVLVCITRQYIMDCANDRKQSNCMLELDYSHVRDTHNDRIIPIVMEPDVLNTSTWNGPVGAYLATKKYTNMSTTSLMSSNAPELVAAIRRSCGRI